MVNAPETWGVKLKKNPRELSRGARWDGGESHLHTPLWALGTVKISSNRQDGAIQSTRNGNSSFA